ncbi:MAG: YhbY family RNA-binding protein [Candidatus Hodarchaeales archaeon]|jgi:RNA-binding protein
MKESKKKKNPPPKIINRQIVDSRKFKNKLRKKESKKEKTKDKPMKYEKFHYQLRNTILSKNDELYETEDFAKKIRHESATIRIGKNGINDGIINEVKNKLEKENAVKVQILKNCPTGSVSSVLQELTEKSGTKLWRKAGRSGILIKNE